MLDISLWPHVLLHTSTLNLWRALKAVLLFTLSDLAIKILLGCCFGNIRMDNWNNSTMVSFTANNFLSPLNFSFLLFVCFMLFKALPCEILVKSAPRYLISNTYWLNCLLTVWPKMVHATCSN